MIDDLFDRTKRTRPTKTYPFGNPDVLLGRIADIAQDWEDDKLGDESAMVRINTILSQNRRLPSQPEWEGDCDE